MDESGDESQKSGSEDEPIVPDVIDDEYFTSLSSKVTEITKVLRQKDTQENADNVQRIYTCCSRFKADLHQEELRTEELQQDVENCKRRMEKAAEISQLDQVTISELRKIIEKAWKQKDSAQLREQMAQEEVMKLRDQIAVLENEVLKMSEKKVGRDDKKDYAKEKEKLSAEIRELNKRIQIQRIYTTEVENMTQNLEEKNKALIKVLDETSSDLYSCKKQLDIATKDLSTLKSEETKLIDQIQTIKLKNDHLMKHKIHQNLQILAAKTNLEHLHTQHNATTNKLAKIIVDLEYTTTERDKLKADLAQKTNLLKLREEELIKMKQENSNVCKSQDASARKFSNVLEAKKKAEEENLRMRSIINTQEKELRGMRKIVQRCENNIEILTKERDVLKRDLILCNQALEESAEQYQEAQHENRSLIDTIGVLEVKQKKQRDELSKISHEKSKKLEEIQSLGDKIDALQNEIHLKENYEFELKRIIADSEAKCVSLQTQHDVLLNEKNILQRSVQSGEEDIKKLRKQIEALNNDLKLFRNRVSNKDAEISKLQLQIDKMEKERRMLKGEFRNSQLAHQHTRSELQEKRLENDQFSKSLQEDENKLSRQKKELDNIIHEKNSVSVQLTKRTEELNQLKDRMDNLQKAYDQTEKQYGQCQDDMRLMRVEIHNLRTERNVLRKDRECAADLRKELLQMHRVLNQQRIKARALQDEMLTPMNIHRWRNLRGRDPEKMDLIQKIQVLRKQILAQNVNVLEQSRALEESQRLYDALKEFMLKLPSYKIKDELNEVKHNLFIKNRKLKSLIAELNTKESDEKAKETLVEDLKANLSKAKAELCAEKKKKQKLLEERQVINQMQHQCFSAPPTYQRSLGGGFKISSS
ncbi:cilia- and flagella-associated protein 58 [Episyrphus balteatus]|uniref:cilia- and flagella-associated protein 58 n=1 Tax=Episyrphus balteatus TaxID=286459 RepID=UPI0024865CB1|nr:cilia- and flagella-associated protein 58 [Episyrphus balteatus]